MLNVCGNSMYKAQMCTSIYYSTDKCAGQWHFGNAPNDGISDSRGSSANEIPSCPIEQANQEVQQEDCHSQHASNQASNA